jgi:hypothetical protein
VRAIAPAPPPRNPAPTPALRPPRLTLAEFMRQTGSGKARG